MIVTTHRLTFVLSIFSALGSAGEIVAADAPARRPNFLVFVADDLGSANVPWRGSDYHMPALDALSKESVRLDVCYTHPMCSATRSALLSGRCASRFGCTGAQNERVYPFGTVTLASALQSVGYETAITGKWHLGSRPDWGPNHFGFQYSYGSLAGGVGPYDHHYKKGPYTETWHRNEVLIQEEGHVTDLIANEAIRWLAQRDGTKPFFLYVPFTAVHIPIDEPQKYLDLNKKFEEPGVRLHAACATHMDEAIGAVLAALDRSGLLDDTLVLFFSDNGGHGRTQNFDTKYPGQYPEQTVAGDNTPLRGTKTQLYDGGIRTAALVRYPDKLKPGYHVTAPIHTHDWMPTFCRLAGFETKQDLKWDGRDVWSQLTGEHPSPEPRTLYWLGVARREQAIRHGDWKLIVSQKSGVELFDLKNDPNETTNLAEREPQHVADLKKLLEQAAANDDDARVPKDELTATP